MGRGSGSRQILPLSELQVRPKVVFLQLPFVGSLAITNATIMLSLRWDGQVARIDARGELPSKVEILVPMSQDEVTNLLSTLAGGVSTPTNAGNSRSPGLGSPRLPGSILFAPLQIAWNSYDLGPSLFALGTPPAGGLYLGAVENWDLVRTFVQAARAEGLF